MGEILFRNADLCSQMYLIRRGRLRYVQIIDSSGCTGRTSSWAKISFRNVRKRSAFQRDKSRNIKNLIGLSHHVERSEVEDINGPGSVEFAEASTWMCEHALWTTWWHRGECSATCSSDVYGLNKEAFEALVPVMGKKAIKVAEHAIRCVRWMNKKAPENLNDLSHKPVEMQKPPTEIVHKSGSGHAAWIRESISKGSFFTKRASVLPRSPRSSTPRSSIGESGELQRFQGHQARSAVSSS